MSLTIDEAVARNLPPHVYVKWNYQHPTGVGGNQIIQVQPASCLSPNKRVLGPRTGLEAKGADNLTEEIDCSKPSEYTWRRSQVFHAIGLRPEKGMLGRTVAICR